MAATGRSRRGRGEAVLQETILPMAVSLVVSLAVALYVSMAFPGVGAWAWLVAATPIGLQSIELLRANRDQRSQDRADASGTLRRADLAGADLSSTFLRGRDLSSARLVDADLSGCNLSGADLTGTRCHRADLTGARLDKARCSAANFYRARLVDADLDGIRAADASFEQADLRQASLIGADLTRADFDGADVRGTNFSRARLADDALDQAITDRTTILADGRRATVVTAVAESAWRSLLATAASVAAWSVLRPVLVGLVGVVAVTGAETEGRLSDGAADSVEVAQRAERGPGDHRQVLDDFGVTPGRSEPVEIDAADAAAGTGSSGDRSAADASSSELVAAGGSTADVPVDGTGAGSTSGSNPTPEVSVIEEAAAPADASSSTPTPAAAAGSEPGPTGPEADDQSEADVAEPDLAEVADPEVLGLVVERGLQVVMGSEYGSSTATLVSPIGSTALAVDHEERLDFEAAPPGAISIVVTPDTEWTVASCTVVADGVEQSQQGLPGQPVTCEINAGPAG